MQTLRILTLLAMLSGGTAGGAPAAKAIGVGDCQQIEDQRLLDGARLVREIDAIHPLELRPRAVFVVALDGQEQAISGTPTIAKATTSRMLQRSCAIGKICWSARYEVLNWPFSR